MARHELQEPRLYADFNGCFGDILCLSYGDTCQTQDGDEVKLRKGMVVTACDENENYVGERDNLITTGVVARTPEFLSCNGSAWSLRIDENGVRNESEIED
jgi:hypothetical protein